MAYCGYCQNSRWIAGPCTVCHGHLRILEPQRCNSCDGAGIAVYANGNIDPCASCRGVGAMLALPGNGENECPLSILLGLLWPVFGKQNDERSEVMALVIIV